MWRYGPVGRHRFGKGRNHLAKLNWQQKLKEECPVFYFYSAQEYLARRQAQQILAVLEKEDPEITQLDGPAPSIEEVIA